MQLRGHVLCPNEHVCVNADKLGVKGYEGPTSRERRATRRQVRWHNDKLAGTGHFEPFDGAASNSSADAVALVASRWSSPAKVITAVRPVAFDAAPDELDRLVAKHSPDFVIATGLANGRADQGWCGAVIANAGWSDAETVRRSAPNSKVALTKRPARASRTQ